MMMTLRLAAIARLNQGVIASLFSTSIVYTFILFYIIYNEKMSRRHLFGMFLMGLGVVFICLGKPVLDSSIEFAPKMSFEDQFFIENELGTLMMIAIILALLTGLIFSINSLVMRYFIYKIVEITPLQLNTDASLI